MKKDDGILCIYSTSHSDVNVVYTLDVFKKDDGRAGIGYRARVRRRLRGRLYGTWGITSNNGDMRSKGGILPSLYRRLNM